MEQTPASKTVEPSQCAQQNQSSRDKYTERYKIIAEMYEIAIEIGSLEVDLVIRQYKFMELRKKFYVNLYGQQEKPSQTDEETNGISQENKSQQQHDENQEDKSKIFEIFEISGSDEETTVTEIDPTAGFTIIGTEDVKLKEIPVCDLTLDSEEVEIKDEKPDLKPKIENPCETNKQTDEEDDKKPVLPKVEEPPQVNTSIREFRKRKQQTILSEQDVPPKKVVPPKQNILPKCSSTADNTGDPESTSVRKESFQCAACEKRFKYKRTIIAHLRIHNGRKPLTYLRCSGPPTQKGNLQCNEKIHTLTKRKFKCAVCAKDFNYKCHLARHIRIHNGEKPFACTFCSARFNQNSSKIIHERIHTGEKPYACAYCSARFNNKGHKTIHERIHKGEKPYKCKWCTKRFIRRDHMKSHEARMHN